MVEIGEARVELENVTLRDISTVTAEVDLNRDYDPESLEDNRGKKKMTLLAVRPTTPRKGVATLFVPEGEMNKPPGIQTSPLVYLSEP